tara:strand:- start:443 stop:550 length:108 start_codon:yes stop_codon:yes gene_type:complete
MHINDMLVLNERFEEEKMLGINRNIEKGFKIPPEK